MGLKEDAEAFRDWLDTGAISSNSDVWQLCHALAVRTIEMTDIPEGNRLATKDDLIGDILPTGNNPKDKEERRRRLDRLTPSGVSSFLEERQDRYHAFIRDRGSDTIIVLNANKGGGRSNKTTFYLQSAGLPAPAETVEEMPVEAEARPYPKIIHWNERPFSEIHLTNKAKRVFGSNGTLFYESWRGRVFRYKAIAQTLGMMLTIYLFVGTLALVSRPVTSRDLATVLLIILLSGCTWLWTMKPFLDLAQMRASILDNWYLKGDQPATLLEKRKTAKGTQMRITRYASQCPVCGADMELANGAPAWPGRIVGRCVDSPQEHVYTFDRVKLIGESLRLPPQV